ncbi:MAG: hypothetical protein Q4C91_07255 [Eubacteriales bacterium]|nr:hypothetical protein [Eubacteriales bacterium]
MFLMTVIILIVLGVIGFYITKRYDMSEKTDKGIEVCYWKLSYRRKFIRTLWFIPVSIIIIIAFYKQSQSYTFAGIIGAMLFILTFVQAIYNYKKWKNEIES